MAALNFGDVFLYKEKEYIFLVATEEAIFAAKILDHVQSRYLDNKFNSAATKGVQRASLAEASPMYCYVLLQTQEYKERAAHYGNSGKDDLSGVFTRCNALCDEDVALLKREIADSGAPAKLRNAVALLG